MITITNIQIKITFKEYEFRRVKRLSNTSAVTYTPKTWVGKQVCVIPMKLTITDRYIENCWNEDKQQYEINTETDVIYKKTVGNTTNVGRITLPPHLIGLDVLIIETPQIKDLY